MVVAIISLLAALIMPSLQRARLITKETICGGDTRSLVQATLVYATEFRDELPDLSLEPDTKAGLIPTYWTWPQWRRIFERKYGITHRQWYSLSNPRWGLDRFYYWGWDGNDPDTATHMVMGRFYFGSGRWLNSDSVWNAMIDRPSADRRPLFPSRVSTKSYYKMLWTDLNRQWPAGPEDWWVTPGDPDRWGANHLYNKHAGELGNWPEGSHVGYLDGSVGWTEGADIELRMTLGGSEYYW